jgi:hypothetical protein
MHYLYGMVTAESSALSTVGQNTNMKQNEGNIYKRGILCVTLCPLLQRRNIKLILGKLLRSNVISPRSEQQHFNHRSVNKSFKAMFMFT